jgi:hypothetical protein
MYDDSYFTIESNVWKQQNYYEFDDHSATEDVKFCKTKFAALTLVIVLIRVNKLIQNSSSQQKFFFISFVFDFIDFVCEFIVKTTAHTVVSYESSDFT